MRVIWVQQGGHGIWRFLEKRLAEGDHVLEKRANRYGDKIRHR